MYLYGSSFIYLIPAMLFAMYAQRKVSSAYAQYAKVRNRKGITGAQAARILLDQNGLSDVKIEMIQGRLSDHYDPRKRIMRLSSAVYNDASIASVSIAAHETGHAIQHGHGYIPLTIRNTIAPAVTVVSNLAWPLLFIGLIMGESPQGSLLFNLGILFFCGSVVFQAVTLPVEFDASHRAIVQMQEKNIIYSEEAGGAKKVLSAAALTYVAALAVAVSHLIRMLAMRGRD